MLEVAITSIKCALRDDFPEFAKFYEEKPWEAKEEIQNSEFEIRNEDDAANEEVSEEIKEEANEDDAD
jgi:hypothetical protein